MTLVKWNRGNRSNGNNQIPAYQSNMPSVVSEFSNMLPRIFDTFSRPYFANSPLQDFFDDSMNLGMGSIGTTLPAVNISETDTDLVIEMAAPGMNKKDFKVEIVEDQLHIAYSHESEKKTDSKNQWRNEFNFESFERYFTLPTIVKSEEISATYIDGILRITVPKKEEARRKPAKAVEIK
jgi:HSP20 family protein